MRPILEDLEGRLVLSPMIVPIADVFVPVGQTFQLPLDGLETGNAALTYSIQNNSNAAAVTTAFTPASNRSIRINVSGVDSSNVAFSGDLVFQLFDDLTPLAATRLGTFAGNGFYNNLSFHRITNLLGGGISSFIAQGGDPNCGSIGTGVGCGSGGSALGKFGDEFSSLVTFNGFAQLAFANAGDDDNDSQFFITDNNETLAIGSVRRGPQHLNFNHTIVGQMTEGFNLLSKLMSTPVSGSTPTTPAHINSVTLVADTGGGAGIDQQNGVLRLTAAGAAGTTSTITVRATNPTTMEFVDETFNVTVQADTSDGTTGGTAVNDRPFLNPINVATTRGTGFNFLIPFTDLDSGDPHTFAVGSAANFLNFNNLVNQPDAANFTVALDQATGRITVTNVNANFTGPIVMRVGVRDGAHGTAADAFDSQVISITVGINMAPTSTDQTTGTTFSTARVITLTGDDGDTPAVQTVNFQITSLPTNGTLLDSANVAITAARLNTNLPSGTVTYTPNANFSGSDAFNFRTQDDGGIIAGGQNTDQTPATVMVNVGQNGQPTADSQMLNTGFRQNLTLTLTGTDGDANVTQTLRFRILALPSATSGTLVENTAAATPIQANVDLSSATIVFRPAATFAGATSFMFVARDDGGTVGGGQDTSNPASIAITVAPNAIPMANSQTVSGHVFAGVDKQITLTGDDGEPNVTQTITFRIQSLPAHGRLIDLTDHILTAADFGMNLPSATLTYAPDLGFTGIDTFTFDVRDDGGTEFGGMDTSAQATVTLNVSAAAADPNVRRNGCMLLVAGDMDSNTIDLLLNASMDRIQVTIDDHDTQVFELGRICRIIVQAGAGNDTITFDENVDLETFVLAGPGDDSVSGSRGADFIDGGAGNDTIEGMDGDDELRGGRGDDSVLGGAGSDTITGGLGDDDLDGEDDNDWIRGFLGDDTIFGSDGQDRLEGNLGDDSIDGGDGDDFLRAGPKHTPIRGLGLNSDNDIVDGGDGDDKIIGGIGDDDLSGNGGNDLIRGGMNNAQGGDTLDGGDGDDSLHGNSGADSLTGGAGLDKLRGGRNADTMEGGGGADTLRGGAGSDDFGSADFNDVKADFMPSRDIEDTSNRFAPVSTGAFTDASLLGTRSDTRPGNLTTSALCPGLDGMAGTADDPNVTTDACHVAAIVDYTTLGFATTEPPTYGPHRSRAASGADRGAPVQPTGVSTAELIDSDAVHNLEHGHVWITYNNALSVADRAALEQLVRDGAGNATGSGVGVLLSPRAANSSLIVLVSWSRSLALSSFDAAQIRQFVNTNRGHAPEGFITA